MGIFGNGLFGAPRKKKDPWEESDWFRANQRADMPPTIIPGGPIPADVWRQDSLPVMPAGGGVIDWNTASKADREKALDAMGQRIQDNLKGFDLPDVSKYGYSPESQGRVEGAGYLRETPFGKPKTITDRGPMADGYVGANALPDMRGPMQGPMDSGYNGMPRTAPKEPPKRWIDGGKFGLREGLGAALAGMSDGMLASIGVQGNSLRSIMEEANAARAAALKAKMAAEQAAQNAAMIRAARPDLNDTQARAIAANVLNPSDFKQPEIAPVQRDMSIASNWGEKDWDLFRKFNEAKNAGMYTAPDGRRYQDSPPPPEFIPDAATEPASPTFAPAGSVNTPQEFEAMRQLYIRQLGPVNGEAAFREYAKSLRR